jgi:uncharacterized membrane protein
MEWPLLLGLAIVWLVDRNALNRRIASLENAAAELYRDVTALRKSATAHSVAPPQATTPPPAAPRAQPAPSAPPSDWRRELPPSRNQLAEARAPESAEPVPPSVDTAIGQLPIVAWVRGYFTSGNVIVRVGVLVLFFGVAFLLKYAAEHSHIPIETRLIGVAIGALVLLGLGWRLRDRRSAYALALQGGGVGSLYLTVFAALRLYALIPATGAFALLTGIGGFTAVLAVRQNSTAFAMMGVVGGFLAPVLTATEHGNHVILFSYYALLDLGVFAIAWFRAWRPLNLLAFVFTFGISAIWGASSYRPELLGTTEPFLAVFFLLFVATAVLFAFRRAPDLLHYVDGTLVFGTPAVVMGAQSKLVNHIPYALAYSALVLGAFYVLLAWLLMRRHRDGLRLVVESFLAIGIAFATLAIPLALQGRWTAACWALEGIAILWVGLRQTRRLPTAVGIVLQGVAGFAYLFDEAATSANVAVANSHFIAAVIVSSGGFLAAALTRRGPAWLGAWRARITTTLFCWGLAWWLYAGLSEIHRFVPGNYHPAADLAYCALTAAVLSLVADMLDWSDARLPPLWLFPVMALAAYLWLSAGHPSAFAGWWAWPLAVTVAYSALRRNESEIGPVGRMVLHVGGLWLVAGLVTWEASWQVDRATEGAWALATAGLIPATILLALPRLARQGGWPVGTQSGGYLTVGAAGLAGYVLLWSLVTNVTSNGDAEPLLYVPALNPLDVAEGLAILATVEWLLALRSLKSRSILLDGRPALFGVVGIVMFSWLNTMLLRSVHHWEDVPYTWDAMMASTLTQASLSLFWTLLALAAMLWSARRGLRLPWFCGAGLMGVVIMKLFLIDLSHIGTVPRIVSFLGVGTLMLVLGYFSPLPPSHRETRA